MPPHIEEPTKVRRASSEVFKKALKWNTPKIINVCDGSDFFMKEADEYREEAWNLIREAKQHKWVITTKWPDRIKAHVPKDWGDGWSHVSLGTSIQSNKTAHHRITHLWATFSKNWHLVVEPILEPIDLRPYLRVRIKPTPDSPTAKLVLPFNQVIIGGEMGPNARPSQPQWYQDIIMQCRFAKTPVFVKQLGTHLAKEFDIKDGVGADFTDLKYPTMFKLREPALVREEEVKEEPNGTA